MESKVPNINTNDRQVEVVKWLIENGGHVEAGAELVELGTAKAVVSIQAEHTGFISQKGVVGEYLPVGQTLVSYHKTQAEALAQISAAAPAVETSTTASVKSEGKFGFLKFSADAEKYISENKIDKSLFQGMGLVTTDMVQETLNPQLKSKKSDNCKPGAAPKKTAMAPNFRSTNVSGLKKAEIDALTTGTEGQINCTLNFTFLSHALRQRVKRENLFDGIILPIILFELGKLLPEHPLFTSFFEDNKIYHYDKVNLGLAMDMGKGLKVVNLAGADQLLPQDIYSKVVDFSMRYLENTLEMDHLMGSTITVTDLSTYGVETFTPLINGKQSVIIGIGATGKAPGAPMTFSVTFDHRVLSGRDIGVFMTTLIERLYSYGKVDLIPQESFLALEKSCSRCGIDNESYQEQFKRFAAMQVIMNASGELNLLCHTCAQGF
ncbi:hypothetical protein CIK05_08950 [Bdellovibrio sp. qaytius]|nr:hypothetical protein CIK05_08950 [Bdellovibrio sp. qaytius]